MNDLFKSPRKEEVVAFLVATLFFAGISLMRYIDKGYTYYPVPVQCIFIVAPFIVVALFRRPEYVYSAILALGMTPYKIPLTVGYGALLVVLLLFVLVRWNSPLFFQDVHKTLLPFFVYTVLLRVLRPETADAISFLLFGFSFFAIPFVFLIYERTAIRSKEQVLGMIRQTSIILFAHLTTILLVPLLTLRPGLYLEGINGIGKVLEGTFGFGMILPYGSPDANFGSMNHAHYAGFALAILAAWCGIRYVLTRRTAWMGLTLVAMYAFAMTETVHAFPGVLAGLILLLLCLFGRRFLLRRGKQVVVVLFAVLVMLPVLFYGFAYGSFNALKDTRKKFFVDAALAQIPSMSIPDLLFGYGAGTYASRAACLRLPLSYGRISAGGKFHYAPERVIKPYGAALAACRIGKGGFTAETEESGLISIPFEFGIVGTSVFLFFLYTILRDALFVFFYAPDRRFQAIALLAVFTLGLIHSTNIFKPAWEMTEVLFLVWPILFLPRLLRRYGMDETRDVADMNGAPGLVS